ncbi:MAG: DUF5606 domain-containing protein [Muribaculaceae bacterium]|nr:DUF5606 domain-containing protein [Muribaculaceae bacterium]
MLKRILAISGRPGLYRLVNHGKNSLIVESLIDGKRFPAFNHEKVMSLGDIAIYTSDGGETPLADVLEGLKGIENGAVIDIKTLEKEGALRDEIAKALPNYDDERVKNSDIKKLFAWYNCLIAAGVEKFKDAEVAEDQAADAAEAADETPAE